MVYACTYERIPPGFHELVMCHGAFSSSLLRIYLVFVRLKVTVFGRELAKHPNVVANAAEEANETVDSTIFPWNLATPLHILIVALIAKGCRVIRREPGL